VDTDGSDERQSGRERGRYRRLLMKEANIGDGRMVFKFPALACSGKIEVL
jgi:hypothetical protein